MERNEEFILAHLLKKVIVPPAVKTQCATISTELGFRRVRTGRGTGVLVHKHVMTLVWE